MNKITRTGLFSLVVLGGIYLYRNRSEIQQFLEARGIKTPLDTSGKLTDTIRSGIAKISGKTEFASDQLSHKIS